MVAVAGHHDLALESDVRVDLHCHCLPGIDDGPASEPEAIELARALVADGMTDVVATPHQLGRFDGTNDADAVRIAVGRLQRALDRERIPLRIHPGGDIRLDERLPRMLREGGVSTIADGGKYLLLELPHEIYVDPSPMIGRLLGMDYVPVITHPERHMHLQKHPGMVNAWVEMGALLQITAGSMTGDFGPQALAMSGRWIEQGLVAVVATDAHNTLRRPPRMTSAINVIESKYGINTARLLCIENPARVLRAEQVSSPIGRTEPLAEAGMMEQGSADGVQRRPVIARSIA